MGKYGSFEERCLLDALKYKNKNSRVLNVKIAVKFQVKYFKLWACIRGIPLANIKEGQNANLSLAQNNALKFYIDYLISIDHQANKKHIVFAENAILKAAEVIQKTSLNNQWVRC